MSFRASAAVRLRARESNWRVLAWSDSHPFDVAERAAASVGDRLTWQRIDAVLRRLDTSLTESEKRMSLARNCLRRAIGEP